MSPRELNTLRRDEPEPFVQAQKSASIRLLSVDLLSILEALWQRGLLKLVFSSKLPEPPKCVKGAVDATEC